MIDFIMFPFLISCYFPVWLLQKKIQGADFLTFTKLTFINVHLGTKDSVNKKKNLEYDYNILLIRRKVGL